MGPERDSVRSSPEASLDRQLALSRVGGDLDLLKEIAALFLDDYPHSLAELHAAAARSDSKALERAAHGLKGSVANFGTTPVFELARAIEGMGRAQQLGGLEAKLTELDRALAALHRELAAL